MLQVEHLRVRRGNTVVVHDASLAAPAGSVTCLLGGNGSGKSTLLNALCGALPADAGSIRLDGQELRGAAPDRMLRAGLALVPQGRELFAGMSVRDNLELGGIILGGRRRVAERLGRVLEVLPGLATLLARTAGGLSGGQQQQVAIGRALMSKPRLLLMDEPSAGLAPLVVTEMVGTVRRLLATGLAVLLVEQNIGVASALARTVYILQHGTISLGGPAEEMLAGDAVLTAYLG